MPGTDLHIDGWHIAALVPAGCAEANSYSATALAARAPAGA
ncbi:MAG TPA: hypothetical protein VKU38_12605 [Ktedonobacteraceae bacterium]|nr:hypothetical protein [Ktedonobacteraceae bacterium]